MNIHNPLPSQTEKNIEHLADSAASHIDQALDHTQRQANKALDSIRGKVSDLRSSATDTAAKAAQVADDLARRSLRNARELGATVKDGAARAGDRTVHYIQDQPVKSMLIAAGIGAGIALWLSSRRRDY